MENVFGALCYATNDSENLGKLQPTADIEIFVGYAPNRKGYRIYNKRTRQIMETIHVTFDELTEHMAPVQSSPGPAPNLLTPGPISLGLVPNPAPAIPYAPPTNKELEMLFQPMFDEYFNPPGIHQNPIPNVAQDPVIPTGPSVSIAIDLDAPSGMGRSGTQEEGQAGSDPGTLDEGQAGSNPGTLDEGQAGSDPSTRDEGQAGPNPDDVAESLPLPTPSVLAGPNLEYSNVEITDPSSQPPPEHMDEGFTALAYPDVHKNLKLTVDEQVIPEEPISSTGTLSSLQHLAKDFSFGDQFLNDKPSEADNEETTADTEAESMVSVTIQQDTSIIPPMTSPVIDLVSRPDSPNVHWPLPTTTTTTAAPPTTTTTITTLPLPPQPQQGSSESLLIKRMGELEQHIANLVKEN
ncbi:hypothetical protein Tco_1081047 [Tanacetum coccineum]|uniref:Retroviral polymerase SH3-like domain-containing protein n=1 Tax=Tanacetum coccineum TaxID=301880 RepID=A0ABQ5HY22_9ASTR